MKRPKLAVGLIVLMLGFTGYEMPLTQAQTVEPPTTAEACVIEDNVIANIKFSSNGQYLAANWPKQVDHINKAKTTTLVATPTRDINIFNWDDQSIRIWSIPTGAIVATLMDEHLTHLNQFAFSPDNHYIVTGGYYSGVRGYLSDVILWDIDTGKELRTFKSQKNNGEITSLSFSPDGQFVLAAYLNTGYSIWNAASGMEETYLAEQDSVYAEFSPDSKLVLTTSETGPTSRVWDRQSGQILHTFESLAPSTKQGRFSPDGKYILVAVEDETILADVQTYQKVRSFETAWSDWQFSPDGKYMLAFDSTEAGLNGSSTILVRHVETGKLVREFPSADKPGSFVIMAFVNNTSVLLRKSSVDKPNPQSIFSVLDVETGRELDQLMVDLSFFAIHSFAVSPDGQYLAIGTEHPAKVTLWDIQTRKPIQLEC